MTGSSSRAFELIVLENGDFWTLYGTNTSSAFDVAGFIKGNGTSGNGSFTYRKVDFRHGQQARQCFIQRRSHPRLDL